VGYQDRSRRILSGAAVGGKASGGQGGDDERQLKEVGTTPAARLGMTETADTQRVQTQLPDLEITLPARAENVAVVRHAVGGLGEVLEVDDQTLSDIKLAVTEACTNVVVHAYDDEPGLLEVAMVTGDDDLTIVVRDHGAGIQPKPARTEPPALGLGLPLIAALSDAFELRGTAGQGTEVRMTFAYVREADPADANPVPGQVGDDGRWEPGEPPA